MKLKFNCSITELNRKNNKIYAVIKGKKNPTVLLLLSMLLEKQKFPYHWSQSIMVSITLGKVCFKKRNLFSIILGEEEQLTFKFKIFNTKLGTHETIGGFDCQKKELKSNHLWEIEDKQFII